MVSYLGHQRRWVRSSPQAFSQRRLTSRKNLQRAYLQSLLLIISKQIIFKQKGCKLLMEEGSQGDHRRLKNSSINQSPEERKLQLQHQIDGDANKEQKSGEKTASAKQEKYENIKEDLNQEEDSKGLLYTDPSQRPKLKSNNSRTVINKYSQEGEEEKIPTDQQQQRSPAKLIEEEQQQRVNIRHQQVVIQQPQLIQQPYQTEQQKRKSNTTRYTELLIAEKQRKFQRLPRLYGKRAALIVKCPSCGKEKRSKLKYDCTGNQWCGCILMCIFGLYPICCVPFCIKRCYNVKHLCPDCHYQLGESGL